ncbi:hypothetical protein BJX76DRAFT_342768 [Aspergillus varians]
MTHCCRSLQVSTTVAIWIVIVLAGRNSVGRTLNRARIYDICFASSSNPMGQVYIREFFKELNPHIPNQDSTT